MIPDLHGTRGLLKRGEHVNNYFLFCDVKYDVIKIKKNQYLHFMIRQHHWINLYGIDQICIIANHTRQTSLSQFFQLFWCER
jgi:hypothetical protein